MNPNKDPSLFPEFAIIPGVHTLKKVGRLLLSAVSMHQLASHGDHFEPNRGGGPALDREIELGHAVLHGEVSCVQAYQMLGETEDGIQPGQIPVPLWTKEG